ncbi:MAG: hypothetical protein KC656_30220, partial [Myxococcales bacterium]|nr:hypothetical protein [Myxococcales bacterium]
MIALALASSLAMAHPTEPPLALPATTQARGRHTPSHRRPRDRGLFEVGVRGGSLVGATRTERTFGDASLGLLVRLRPTAPLAVEVSVDHADQTFAAQSARRTTTGQLSGMFFLFPRFVVSPYGLVGMSVANQDLRDQSRLAWGPHAGLGLEFNLGKHFAIDVDAR